MQQVDFTTLWAACQELQTAWIPAKVETVCQWDKFTLAIGLRNFSGRGWLLLSWHPEAARLHLTSAPPRDGDTFTLSQQLRSLLGGLALIQLQASEPWERLIELRFAPRPGEEAQFCLWVEVMGKYSNITLTDGEGLVITTAHQVSAHQSSVRTIQTGQPYLLPPRLLGTIPRREETEADWRERLALVPGPVVQQAIACYRGLSTNLMRQLLGQAQISINACTESLTPEQWQGLFAVWQQWLGTILGHHPWQPARTLQGYNLWGIGQRAASVNGLLDEYYRTTLEQLAFGALHHQLSHKLQGAIAKLTTKAQSFQARLADATTAELWRQQADLLMAHLHQWRVGMTTITLADFATSEPVTLTLNPEKTGSQNAQALYRRYQKLRRSELALQPLLASVQAELDYLHQVETSVRHIAADRPDLAALIEIREELVQGGYLPQPPNRSRTSGSTSPRRWLSPSGFEILIGRNNRQNDLVTFKTATAYDLWFHAQEIAGSHGLLRLPPGAVAQTEDLQYMANLIAYYSRGRLSEAVPVVYTAPKYVSKPKGAKPGMVIYRQETVIWGHPQRAALGELGGDTL